MHNVHVYDCSTCLYCQCLHTHQTYLVHSEWWDCLSQISVLLITCKSTLSGSWYHILIYFFMSPTSKVQYCSLVYLNTFYIYLLYIIQRMTLYMYRSWKMWVNQLHKYCRFSFIKYSIYMIPPLPSEILRMYMVNLNVNRNSLMLPSTWWHIDIICGIAWVNISRVMYPNKSSLSSYIFLVIPIYRNP